MSGATVKLEGLSKLEQRLNKVSDTSAKLVKDELARGALDIQNEMRTAVMKGPATGRFYRHGKVVHQASAPGEAPMSDSGNLASHINHVFPNPFSAEVGVFGVPYAHRLEYGGKDSRGGYIAPRPYLRPALKKYGSKLIDRISTAVKEALRVG